MFASDKNLMAVETMLYLGSRNMKTEIPGSPDNKLLISKSGCDTGNRASYMCRKCRAHGALMPVKRHKRTCPFNRCNCTLCELVSQGRHIVAKQIALYRDQRGNPNSKNNHNHASSLASAAAMMQLNQVSMRFNHRNGHGSNSSIIDGEDGPHCRKCRNHGITSPWKGHKKKCLYRQCVCDQCILISLRKTNEKTLREMVMSSMDETSTQISQRNQITEQNNNLAKNSFYTLSANLVNSQCIAPSHYSPSIAQHDHLRSLPWSASSIYHASNLSNWDNRLCADNQAMSAYSHPAYNPSMLMSNPFMGSGITHEHHPSAATNPWNAFY